MKTLKEELGTRVAAYDLWAQRRRHGQDGHNNRKLWVLACMDERLPIDEALGASVMPEVSLPMMQFAQRC